MYVIPLFISPHFSNPSMNSHYEAILYHFSPLPVDTIDIVLRFAFCDCKQDRSGRVSDYCRACADCSVWFDRRKTLWYSELWDIGR